MYSNNTLIQRKQELEKEIASIRKELGRMPKGSLIINHSSNRTQWYHKKYKNDGTFDRIYIKRNDRELAEKLARKSYLHFVLSDKQNELQCLEHYIMNRNPKDYGKYLSVDSPYRELLLDSSWDRAEYIRSNEHPENLIIPTIKGDLVRSKSEALIANALYEHNIPYRYEEQLMTEFFPIYPDFTVRKLRVNRLIRWEHFGKIDDPDYREKVGRKLVTYMENGYVPGQDLIMTFEDKAHPLTIDTVQAMIQQYFL